ncbi:MAG: MFS transporter, partial [Pseudomonadota bacterium]
AMEGGWRLAALVFAALILLVAVPLTLWGVRRLGPPRDLPEAGEDRAPVVLPFGRPAFWFLTLAFPAIALSHGVIIAHILPFLDERGVAPATALAAVALIGPSQVAGRVALMAIGSRAPAQPALLVVFGVIGAGIALMAVGGPVGLFPAVVLFGGAYGVVSILRPVVTAEILGREGFGRISGALALPYQAALAAAPFAGALLWSAAGYDVVMGVAVAIVLAGGVAFRAAMARR